MGEITTLIRAATNSTSLRTTVPASIVKQFYLKEGDQLDWFLIVKGESIVILVQPLARRGDLKRIY